MGGGVYCVCVWGGGEGGEGVRTSDSLYKHYMEDPIVMPFSRDLPSNKHARIMCNKSSCIPHARPRCNNYASSPS